MKKWIAICLLLATVLSLCACGSKKTEEPAGYTVTVLDENGAPIPGAMVQLCKDVCVLGVTDADGVAYVDMPEDDYKAAFAVLPSGYTYEGEIQEFFFEKDSKNLTITLKKAE